MLLTRVLLRTNLLVSKQMIQINGLTAGEQKLEEQKRETRTTNTSRDAQKDPATALTLLIGLFTAVAVKVCRERMLI